MAYKIGNTKYLKPLGSTEETACTDCGEKVELQVFSNQNYQFAFRFPPFEVNDVCFSVCPRCAAVHQIMPESVETRRTKDGKKETVITKFQLEELKTFD